MSDETYIEGGREYYSSNDNPVWPSRHREHPSAEAGDQSQKNPLIEDSYVQLLLSRIDELEKKTRPSAGAAGADRKDFAAFQALKWAGALVEHVAGWAIDHQLGLAFERRRFVPLQPSSTKEHPQYLATLKAVNNHQHEKTGACLRFEDDRSPETARRILINLLHSNAGAMPRWLAQQAIESLEALEYGEVRPIFKPLNESRKRDLTLLRLQLKSLAMVAFRRKLGMLKGKAVEEVADALGQSPNTVLSWNTRLKEEFGPLEIDRTIAIAENHASWVVDARKRRLRGEDTRDVEVHEASYNEAALSELATQYKKALR
ncbi:hypothetical protein ACVWZR_004438 [Bradyrhizobium sp. i1.3.1]